MEGRHFPRQQQRLLVRRKEASRRRATLIRRHPECMRMHTRICACIRNILEMQFSTRLLMFDIIKDNFGQNLSEIEQYLGVAMKCDFLLISQKMSYE